ncbi:sugar-binding domain-containing protein [Pedobacter rhizosphaerae]|uniref:beta-galactosidase n=1 Tax=Pedobacter rhizosphaerae TaxID=390241 RepID=A0A1H9SK33_9SPHI|nr:sugar-binding domain-containing protein [Pedobacter rhizosphaerae]SER85045.1 Glycosyl hydrolases family 2, TIM barrel domain [Pedobacter rhizosphaerae]
MRKLLFHLFLVILLFFSCKPSGNNHTIKIIDLSGEWLFREDRGNIGENEKWYQLVASDKVILPGSMSTNGKGDEVSLKTRWIGSIFDSAYFFKPEYARYRQKDNIKIPFGLQPNKHYTGVSWYQREIDILDLWKGKRLQLILERPHWQTKVWLDDQLMGSENSLSTPHVFTFGKDIKPGKHRLSVRIDNGLHTVDPGQNAHSVTDHTQTNWNGIVGQILIRPIAEVAIENIQIYPNTQTKKVKVKICLNNLLENQKLCKVKIQASQVAGGKYVFTPVEWNQVIKGNRVVLEREYDMSSEVKLWDEFAPNVYALNISISSGGTELANSVENFGFRSIKTNQRALLLNNRRLSLRGTVDCAIFPLTGYPPTDRTSWDKIFKKIKSYGMNHVRFHSWCPPEAAFDAADAAGFYLQIECASWANWGSSLGDGQPIDKYIYEEGRKIINAYGNHPSFVMLTYGNEPKRTEFMIPYLKQLVKYWKSQDDRRIYTSGAGRPVIEENDYHNIPDPRIQHAPIGLKSIINGNSPSTDYDWHEIINAQNKPVIAHEMGQWCVYPDFSEVKKYTGILKARNFEIFADRLKEHGLSHLADSFLLASGKLQVLCYKADVEAALRTPEMGGFQLLGLQDFPGQGTAIIGVLNSFYEDKPYITAKNFSKFCNPVVPLARFPKLNILNNQVLDVPVEVSNFGENIIADAIPKWKITNVRGEVLFKGNLRKQTIGVGKLVSLGAIRQSLHTIKNAQKLILSIQVGNQENNYDFFVYPAKLPEPKDHILVTQMLDAKARKVLNAGGNVLLTFAKGTIAPAKGGDISVGFSSIFWNTAWTKGAPPHTLGILCDPKHPALANFPADFHSNWQWWDAMSHSDAIILDAVAKNIKPIARIIDDWVTARSLGLIFEARVGKGRIMVTGLDLLSNANNRPEARQLMFSLRRYMESKDFNPKQVIALEKIEGLLNEEKQLSRN